LRREFLTIKCLASRSVGRSPMFEKEGGNSKKGVRGGGTVTGRREKGH